MCVDATMCKCCLSRQEGDFELYRCLSIVIKTMHPRAFSPAMFLAFSLVSSHVTSCSASQGSKTGRNLHQQGGRQGDFEGLPGHVQQENQGLAFPVHEQWEHVHLVPLRVPGLPSLPVSTAPPTCCSPFVSC